MQPARQPTEKRTVANLAAQSFLTQYPSVYNPGATDLYNANCGPASLAMVLRALDVAPKAAPEALIMRARVAMTGSAETGSWTYPDQIAAAAPKFGLAAREVHGLSEVRQAVARPGHYVILNLNPGPAYAQRLYAPFDGGHFAVLLGFDRSGAILDDPMARGPALHVPATQLERALEADLGPGVPPYDGGIELWRAAPAASAASSPSGA